MKPANGGQRPTPDLQLVGCTLSYRLRLGVSRLSCSSMKHFFGMYFVSWSSLKLVLCDVQIGYIFKYDEQY